MKKVFDFVIEKLMAIILIVIVLQLIFIELTGNWGDGIINTFFNFISCNMDSEVYWGLVCN